MKPSDAYGPDVWPRADIEAGVAGSRARPNVADEDGVERTFAAIEHAFGTVDVLVNDAGITGADKATHELSLLWTTPP